MQERRQDLLQQQALHRREQPGRRPTCTRFACSSSTGPVSASQAPSLAPAAARPTGWRPDERMSPWFNFHSHKN